ncbi:DUF1835 domain-containing protein [Nocardia sp. NEAU-G5]|uniref:DUF1835 domain-containing protein n=1 Tax=Nocardia albiluteola TaxID=2842303 RepID=A0ABS6AV47_9NOCA|nr:DUF3658 domain-containing protein [Nocardia albiluteola]MBU3061121.1 DUF1835 domain-containing protein [Nocardia albiluteola]
MTTVHVAPNGSSAASIRTALDAAGAGEVEVVACSDDLSYGPIDGADRREWWTSAVTGDFGRRVSGWGESFELDLPRLAALGPDVRIVLWVGRRSPQEFATYLYLVDFFRMRSLHVIEVSGPREPAAAAGRAAALPPSEIGALLGSERALDATEREELVRQWAVLRAENAPLRVMSDGRLVSAPIDWFDEVIVSHVPAEPAPMPRVIAEAMGGYPAETHDYVLQQRVVALIDSGVLAAEGDPLTARMCRIRRVPR